MIQLKNALAKRAEMDILGYSYQQQRSFDTLEKAASNEGNGAGLMQAGIGLGMGVGVGGALGQTAAHITKNLSTEGQEKLTEKSKVCSNCGTPFNPDARFCFQCGRKINMCGSCGHDFPNNAAKCPECGAPAPALCPQCGHTIDSDMKFCPFCGMEIKRICPSCGKNVEIDARFCPSCGQKIDEDSAS